MANLVFYCIIILMVNRLLSKLLVSFQVFAPVKNGQSFVISKITQVKEADYSGKITENSWKNIFLPPSEDLFYFNVNQPKEPQVSVKNNVVAWGMSVLDLKALGLFDLVFAKDFYYQRNRKNILVVGLSVGAPAEFKDWQVFAHGLEENILEHLPFDIFLEKQTNNQFKIYASTDKGENILEKNKINDYEHLEFSGLIPEEGPDKKMLSIKDKMGISQVNNKVWQELGKICLACGKCSMVCPTCFCFDIYDEATGKDQAKRIRSWGNCFYPDFSKIADGQSVLKNVADKIHFWYEHKFFRIPSEYKVPGCVSCLRCDKVCPVGIKIQQTLKEL